MADFELKKTDLKVRVYGQDYTLRKPSISQVEDILEHVGKDDSKNISVMKSFLETCGVPKDVCNDMDADDFNALAEFIMTSTKKKIAASGINSQS